MILTAKAQVLFYIRKTLDNFCRNRFMSMEEFLKGEYNTTYYPATLWHQRAPGVKREAPDGIPKDCEDFYTTCAKEIWETLMTDGKLVTFDSVVKRVQLNKYYMDCTALLVDESQDLDAAQIDWLVQQALDHKTKVWFVGDAAQTIYSFPRSKID